MNAKLSYIFNVILLLVLSLMIILPNKKEKTDTDNNKVIEIIHQRKSVRHFTDKKITEQQLLTLAKAGMAAPSAKNAQPWHIMSITDRAILDSLGANLPYCKMIHQTNAAIVVCGDMTKAFEGEGATYWVQDCSAVTQNILLAAESMGLGAVWTGVYPISERVKTVSSILQLPSYITPLCVIPVGYPTGEDTPKDKWNENLYHINVW